MRVSGSWRLRRDRLPLGGGEKVRLLDRTLRRRPRTAPASEGPGTGGGRRSSVERAAADQARREAGPALSRRPRMA